MFHKKYIFFMKMSESLIPTLEHRLTDDDSQMLVDDDKEDTIEIRKEKNEKNDLTYLQKFDVKQQPAENERYFYCSVFINKDNKTNVH